MEKNFLLHPAPAAGAGAGAISRKMLRERAVELAATAGRPAQAVSKTDWEQAKRELAAGDAGDANQAALEAAPESERWDPLPGSAGEQVPESPGQDEDDDEGHNQSAQLAEDGAEEAGRDQRLPSVRAEGDRRQP